VTGDYTFHRYTVKGCDSIVTLHLIVTSPYVKLHSIPEKTICDGNTTTLTASPESLVGSATYVWSPDATLSAPEGVSVIASPTDTTIYKLVATATLKTGALSCTFRDSLEVKVNVNPVYHVTDSKSICQSELPIVWNGVNFTAPGVKIAILSTVNGCDSIVTMTLVANPKTYGDTIVVACESFTWHDSTYTVTPSTNPTYTMVGGNQYGCDSVITLKLTINHPVHTSTSLAAYDSYTWHGITYTTTGIYTYMHADEHGCMQVDTLHLIIDTLKANEFSIVECISYKWNDSIYTVSGDYQQTFKNIHGLDSVVTLHLIINNPVHEAETAKACDSYNWHGVTYTASGNYTYPHNDANGCLQVDTLHLTITHSNTGVDVQEACDEYKWIDGNIYIASTNTPTYTLTNAEGCDSVVTLNLTIHPSYLIIVNDTICKEELPYYWRDTVFLEGTVSGNYVFHRNSVHGCDSTVVLSLIINQTTVEVTSHTDEICGNDGTITVSATGKYPIKYSIDGGMNFQTATTFTGLPDATYTVLAVGANSCSATATAVIAPAVIPTLSISCPPDVHDTLAYGDCVMKIYPVALGTPTATHSLGWPYTISNDMPADSLFYEGDNVVKWVMTDNVCGYKDSCKQHVFIVFPKCPDAIDCEGNVYHSVRIDCDCWTQRNLESKKYSDCSDIPCVYNYVSTEYPNVTDNVNIYGRLYCFEAAIRDSADNGHGHIQGICPAGWYLPTPEKYEALNVYGTSALKSPLYWIPTGGDNSTGFSALPAGFYNGSLNRYEGLRGETFFWSTKNTGSATKISAFEIFLDCDVLIETHKYSGVGYSVRCIKEKE
jgi:uncharacterized protein (TIGR02145 family)